MRQQLLITFFAFIGTFLFQGCTKNAITRSEEFTLAINKEAHLQENSETTLSITYQDLVEESRCAPGVVCVWAGRVLVKLKVNNEEIQLGLGHDQYPNSTTVDGYAIDLLSVKYSSDSNFGDKNKSSIVLRVN